MLYQKIQISILIIGIMLFSSYSLEAQEANDEDNETMQYVDWGLEGGISHYGNRYQFYDADGWPKEALPMLGIDASVWLDYHISDNWDIRFVASATMERCRYLRSDSSSIVTGFGIDLGLPFIYRLRFQNGTAFFGVGPYTHFLLFSISDANSGLNNPFNEELGDDPVTGDPLFSMNGFNAGIAATIGYEFRSKWLWALNLKWGITNQLNTSQPDLFAKSLKVTACIGHRF